jgi:hypothetical protein
MDRITDNMKRAELQRKIVANIRDINTRLTTSGQWQKLSTEKLEEIERRLSEALASIGQGI